MPGIDCVAKKLNENNIEFILNAPLAKYTTFKIGGNTKVLCTPKTIEQLQSVISICNEQSVKYYILGKGSNILFSDDGYNGVIIHIGDFFNTIEIEKNEITVFAGASLSNLSKVAAKNALTGLEFAFGIPGNVGGAVYMNAGAYDGEIKDVLKSVTFLDENAKVLELPASELMLGYRTSVFEIKKWCIIKAVFCLKPGNTEDITFKMNDFAKRRVEKQPLDMPSAGSTFKRPKGAFAGALIEQCGLKGFTVGGAQISTKHCGFVVNIGGATCKDVLDLSQYVCEKVKNDTGFNLEREIRVVK